MKKGFKSKNMQENNDICNIIVKKFLKNGNYYVIIRLPKFVNKHINIQINAAENKNIKKGFVEKMPVLTSDVEVKNKCIETKEEYVKTEDKNALSSSKYINFEAAALYLVAKFFKTKLKNSEGEYTLMHCTVHKIEKLLAIVEFIYLKQGESKGLFAEDIIIKNCGVGFDLLEWVPDIINMRKFENPLDTGEDNKTIAGRCIVDNSFEVSSAFNYKKGELNNNIASIINNVFIKFANYKANYLGADIDNFKDFLTKEDSKTIDKQKVASFFNIHYGELENNDVYNFIVNYKF